MEVRAVSKFVRISPRKTNLVAALVRDRKAPEAMAVLQSLNKYAARIIAKTLASAISNAKNKDMDEKSLWIKSIKIDGGPMYKRYMPRAMGRATMIKHRTSHINILLSDERGGVKKETEEPKPIKKETQKKEERKKAETETKKIKGKKEIKETRKKTDRKKEKIHKKK